MTQSITLNDLLDLQNSKNSIYVGSVLNTTGLWVSNDLTFGRNQTYTWYKALPGEEFEPYTKDQIRYIKSGIFDPAITYITLTKANFDNVKASVESIMMLDKTLLDDPKAKMYKYSGASVVVEVIEPFQALKHGVIRYAFMIYTKKDYDSGFKIR